MRCASIKLLQVIAFCKDITTELHQIKFAVALMHILVQLFCDIFEMSAFITDQKDEGLHVALTMLIACAAERAGFISCVWSAGSRSGTLILNSTAYS